MIPMPDATHKKGKKGKKAAAAAAKVVKTAREKVLEKLLPEPLAGWSAEHADSKAMGAAMFGGATTAERRYIKNDSSISIKFSTDSPMMQSMLMMFSNPIFAASAGKIELINGQKAIVDFKETSGNMNIVIGNNILITIEGNNIKRDDLMAYAGKIDMAKLAKLP